MIIIEMSGIMSAVATVFGAAMDWAGIVGTMVTNTPVLLLFVVLPLVGLGVGLFRRLLGR